VAQSDRRDNTFQKISCPEKRWAICHIFIAKRAYKITKHSLIVTDSILQTQILGTDFQGGDLDAFKHAYWMASLSQHIKWKKAYRLGTAHEKGNYKSFKKGKRKGKINLPDKASSEMDMWNNKAGLIIGRENQNISKIDLQQLVIQAIRNGEMRILKRDSHGNFVTCQNQLIPVDILQGNWDNNKCLEPSGNSINE
jgi:hypothetical protein